jgi:hypothetical protein
MSYACALSIKSTQPDGFNDVAVVTNTPDYFTDKEVFDKVITYVGPVGMSARINAYEFSPYDHTVLLDSDMLFTRSFAHFWPAMESSDILFSSNAVNIRGDKFKYGPYRELFEKNLLPDIYTAWTFFKKSSTAKAVFDYARHITQHSSEYYSFLVVTTVPKHDIPTDEAMAFASIIMGLDSLVEGGNRCPTITHMKSGVQWWGEYRLPVSEFVRIHIASNGQVMAGPYSQLDLFHYVDKDFVNDDILTVLESLHD